MVEISGGKPHVVELEPARAAAPGDPAVVLIHAAIAEVAAASKPE